MRPAPAADVRACIAAHVLGPPAILRNIGAVTLYDHQVLGAERVRRIISLRGGAVLADDVGLGKTYIALALARDAGVALVLAPATLRHEWESAITTAGVRARFMSFEQLGRGATADPRPDFVIVDEAHHLRSRTTRRFVGACSICADARVLLLTATPVQNRTDDLRAIVSLFLGERALALAEGELAGFVVRRTEADVGTLGLPSVKVPQWLEPVEDVDCLDRLLALPSPLPPRDGGDGGVLLSYTLVRQWASSRAALRAALHRRLAAAHAMEDALLAGRIPARDELRAWCFADGTQQLAFPDLVVGEVAHDVASLLRQVRSHRAGVRDLLDWIRQSPDPDVRRASALRALLRRHPGERMVCFSEYSATVTVLYGQLATSERCAMITHSGGRVASGAIRRRELLERFAPGTSARTVERERIDVLLSTDVLSEGVSLQDASVVVHLDLAWNPARLEQRVGRVRRIGAVRDVVSVYVMPLPAPAERLLDMERRLQGKIGDAARSVGLAGVILPGMAATPASASRDEENIDAILRAWRCARAVATPVAAAVRASRRGALACVRQHGATKLLAIADGQVSESRHQVLELLRHATVEDIGVPGQILHETHAAVERWLRTRAISNVVDLSALRVARSRRAVLRRVEVIAHRAPRHSQPALAPLMNAARCAASVTLSAGAERVLDELARAPMGDDAWLRAVSEFASVHARDDRHEGAAIIALLLLLPS